MSLKNGATSEPLLPPGREARFSSARALLPTLETFGEKSESAIKRKEHWRIYME
jgi:hypothetical protein